MVNHVGRSAGRIMGTSFHSMSIRIKLALTLAALGAGAALISGYIAYRNTTESLTRAVWQGVRAVRIARAQQVEAYFRTVQRHTNTLSESRNFIEAMDEFRAAFEKLNQRNVDPATTRSLQAYFRDKHLPELAKATQKAYRVEDFLPGAAGAWYLQSR